MSFNQPTFEKSNVSGSTAHFNGTATLSAVAVPTVAAGVIETIEVNLTDSSNQKTDNFEISIDGGSNYFPLGNKSDWVWEIRGAVTQVFIKANRVGMVYNILMNRESV